MSYSYDRYERQRRQTYGASMRRSAFGYWIPLALTVTVATVGLVAWIWSERSDGDDDEDYKRTGESRLPGYQDVGPGGVPYAPEGQSIHLEDGSMISRMSGALRRTPSPQQILDGASRRVVAGVAAAGAAVGGALSSIREEDKRDYEDHARWSDEADSRGGEPSQQTLDAQAGQTSSANRQAPSGTRAGGKTRTVAVVVSAETDHTHDDNASYLQEHASILSHLPHHLDSSTSVFVLIYAPDLKQHPLTSSSQTVQPNPSLTSSYSNIGHEDLLSHSESTHKPLAAIDPSPISPPPGSRMFNKIYAQAQALVENDTMIMPFTVLTGSVHILRHLGPEVVYIQETLSGTGGDVVHHISGWVGQVILVVGDEGGHGGLVDSEDERGMSGDENKDKWWHNNPKIGLGKGIEVVEGIRMGEDWRRRVGGHD